MTILTPPVISPATSRRSRAPAATQPVLRGIGTAVPALCRPQDEIARDLAKLWNLDGESLTRWERIIAGTMIQTRCAVALPEQIIHLTTSQRMAMYEQHAPPLAERAAVAAMEASGVSPAQITDLIVVSCTGFSAPGLDAALVERLGLPLNTRRTIVGFMGCFGAIIGLRSAIGACSADRNATALVVCAELCSLHIRADADPQNQVASALFADGAAAAVVGQHSHSSAGDTPIGTLNLGATLLLPEGAKWMTWRITDAGFAMTLTRQVPVALRRTIAKFVDGSSRARPPRFIVHPGGPGILDAVAEALELDVSSTGIDASRDVLRRFGNMSSGTVLFVLEEAMRRRYELPAMMLAFGPGLTIESLSLLPIED